MLSCHHSGRIPLAPRGTRQSSRPTGPLMGPQLGLSLERLRRGGEDAAGTTAVQHDRDLRAPTGAAESVQRRAGLPAEQDSSHRGQTSAHDRLVSHNPKVVGSNPTPATKKHQVRGPFRHVRRGGPLADSPRCTTRAVVQR